MDEIVGIRTSPVDHSLKEAIPRLEAITERIIRCAYRVDNLMGFGFIKSVYEECIATEIRNTGIGFDLVYPVILSKMRWSRLPAAEFVQKSVNFIPLLLKESEDRQNRDAQQHAERPPGPNVVNAARGMPDHADDGKQQE